MALLSVPTNPKTVLIRVGGGRRTACQRFADNLAMRMALLSVPPNPKTVLMRVGVCRRTACQRFADDPAVRVALLSVTAAGTGLDFSAAGAVVFAELPEEVALVRQAEARGALPYL